MEWDINKIQGFMYYAGWFYLGGSLAEAGIYYNDAMFWVIFIPTAILIHFGRQ